MLHAYTWFMSLSVLIYAIVDGWSHNKWDEERFGSMLMHSMDKIDEIVNEDSNFEFDKVICDTVT